jgi:membrane protein implicated in regulation of membrane protease activity
MAMKHRSQSFIGSDGALGVFATLTGLGVVTLALAPLALPILILTLAALLPLAVPLIVLAIPLAIVLAIRGAYRRLTRTGHDRDNRFTRARAQRRQTDDGSQGRVARGMAEGARRAARA